MNLKITGDEIIYLHPGEICFSVKEVIVSTVLGSCLSVIMYSRKHNFSGISHCMLPKCKDTFNGCEGCVEKYKYVDCTVKNMIERFERINIKKEDIEVKIFGGSDILKPVNTINRVPTIGAQNIEMAFSLINKHKLKIISSDVGGDKGRRIFFKTNTGEVFLKRMKKYAED